MDHTIDSNNKNIGNVKKIMIIFLTFYLIVLINLHVE